MIGASSFAEDRATALPVFSTSRIESIAPGLFASASMISSMV